MGLKPVSVSQLNSYIKRILQSDPILGNVSVIGEISNLKFHGTGHVYFSLKDQSSTINCFLPSDRVESLGFIPEEGKEVICHGYLYLYERGGRYSLNVRDMEESGEGELMVMFRMLRDKLEKEGLFSQEHKRPIPAFPKKIAVVTSETGAAVRDILKIIRNKNDVVDVLIYPVLVQGPAAADDIAAAIYDINDNYRDVDTIIAGRGGGSMEDLWAFNEEVVARAIYHSEIPVISAVGHEIDVTISDFVADKRAETPTAAADIAVPDTNRIREDLEYISKELSRELNNKLQFAEQKLLNLNPEISARDLMARVVMEQMRIDNLIESSEEQMKGRLRSFDASVEACGEVLRSSDPNLILARGYSIVRAGDGSIVKEENKLNIGNEIDITFSHGSVTAQVTSKRGE